jgi:hypothetical protein
MAVHDLHDFVMSAQRALEDEYARIQKRAAEDPGTAGDQGEENWATLLRAWLPKYFHVVTKGRIIAHTGYTSPQIDVLVLSPSYPTILLDKKHYLAGGVVAAFECKITLKASHVQSAVETAATIRRIIPKETGSPYKELNSTIIYGLLAHSHSWKGAASTPVDNVDDALWAADGEHVKHPIELLDYLCVADLATWSAVKVAYISPQHAFYERVYASNHGPDGFGTTSYLLTSIGADQQKHYSPLGTLLSGLFSKLAWRFHDMRGLEAYFRNVDLRGAGGGNSRTWPISAYSEDIRSKLLNGNLKNTLDFDEWQIAYC